MKKYFVWGLGALMYVVVFFHRVATGVVREEVLLDFGLLDAPSGGTLFTLLGVMYMYAYMLMQIPTGILADTLGPRKTISLGALLATIGSFIFAMSQGMGSAFLGRFIVGIGVAVVFVCILKIIADWFPKEQFATMSGLTSFIGNLGALLAMTPLALLTEKTGWRQGFISIGVISGVLAVLCWFFIKEKESLMEETTSAKKEPIFKVLFKMIKNKRLYPPMLIFALTFGATMALTANWGVTMLQDLYKVDKTWAANRMSIMTLGVAIGCIVVGKISDYVKSHKKPIIYFAGTHLLCWIVLTLQIVPTQGLFVLFFLLGFTGTSFVIGWGYAKEQYPAYLAGTAMSMINFVGFLGGAVIPQIVGGIYDFFGGSHSQSLWTVVLVFLTMCSLGSFICAIMLKENKIIS